MARDYQTVRRRTVLKTIGGGVLAGGSIVGLSGSVAARRGTLYNLTVNKDDDVAHWSDDAPGWQVDRAQPDEWVRETGHPHNNVIRKNIDESGDTSGFSAFQGMKYLAAGGERWVAEIPRRLTTNGSIFIDSDWEAAGEKRRTGLWYALGDDAGGWNWFDIVEYRSGAVTGDDPSFFRFGSEDGYEEIGLPRGFDPNRGGWVGLEMRVEPGEDESDIEWRIGGERMVKDTIANPFGAVDHFQDFFVNSVNFGVNQDYFFDNFKATIS